MQQYTEVPRRGTRSTRAFSRANGVLLHTLEAHEALEDAVLLHTLEAREALEDAVLLLTLEALENVVLLHTL